MHPYNGLGQFVFTTTTLRPARTFTFSPRTRFVIPFPLYAFSPSMATFCAPIQVPPGTDLGVNAQGQLMFNGQVVCANNARVQGAPGYPLQPGYPQYQYPY